MGDYGMMIDQQTNELERRGDIFTDEEIVAMVPELTTYDVRDPQTTLEEDISHETEITELGPSECVVK
jgi:hypothetical protein